MVTKDLLDLWDAIKSIREDVKALKEQNLKIQVDYLQRSYDSISERLDVIQKDVDSLKSR